MVGVGEIVGGFAFGEETFEMSLVLLNGDCAVHVGVVTLVAVIRFDVAGKLEVANPVESFLKKLQAHSIVRIKNKTIR